MAETINCPECLAVNDAANEHCAECGALLAREDGFAEPDFSAGYGFELETSVGQDEGEAGEELLVEDGFIEETLAADGGMPLDSDVGVQDEFVGGVEGEISSLAEQTADDAQDDFAIVGEEYIGGEEFSQQDVAAQDFEPTSDDDALYQMSDEDSSLADETSVAQSEEAVPTELAEVLNPPRVDAAPIEALPVPGTFLEPATVEVFYQGVSLETLAIDDACTVLGRASAEAADEPSIEYELEPIGEEFPFEANEVAEAEPAFDLEALDESEAEEMQPASAEISASAFERLEESSVGQAAQPSSFEDAPGPDEGATIDLGVYGEPSNYAQRHGYIFRQHKNYTLYVVSDMGTQINDELLTLGEQRRLNDGDIIILGGQVALKFALPAA